MSHALHKALKEEVRNSVHLVEFVHDSGTVRLATGFRNVDADTGSGEHSFTGAGAILDLKLPAQSSSIEVSSFSISLSGISSDYEHLANEKVRGTPINIWIAFLNEQGSVAALELLESGLADRPGKKAAADNTITLTLDCVGNFGFLATQTRERWTAEHNKLRLEKLNIDPATDTGFDTQHGIPQQNDGWFRPG